MDDTFYQPRPFVYKDSEFTPHLRFSKPHLQSMYVAIHAGCYCKQLVFLDAMFRHLKSIIPFQCNFEEPSVEILAGPCFKHMAQVQVRIDFSKHCLKEEAAVEALKREGFFEGLEYTL